MVTNRFVLDLKFIASGVRSKHAECRVPVSGVHQCQTDIAVLRVHEESYNLGL